jgi:hypothetical protein
MIEYEPNKNRFSNLTIDPQQTSAFYQIRDEGSSPMKVALNEAGEKVLLKTSIVFADENDLSENTALSTDNLRAFVESFASSTHQPSFEAEYQVNKEALFAEEQAARLAKHFGIRMPEAKLVTIDDVPFIAYEYIDGIRDTSYGIKAAISESYETRKEQETALAAGAMLKLLLKTLDGGQFLQDKDGNIYLSDIGVINLQNRDTEQTFERSISDFFIPRSEEMLAHQIAGAQTPEFSIILQKLNELSFNDVIGIISQDPENPTPNEVSKSQSIIDRKKFVVKLFSDIVRSPKEVFAKILAQRNKTN